MTPAHVGVILGGTALWAQSNGTLTLEAYSRVCAKQIEIVEWCWAAGVTELTLQILAPEVSLAEKQAVVAWEQVLDHFRLGWPTVPVASFNLIGGNEALGYSATNSGQRADDLRDGPGLIVNLILEYEGRQEIVNGVRRMLATARAAGTSLAEVVADLDSANLEKFLDTGSLAPIDFVIRASAVAFVPEFLPWKSVYAEFYLTSVPAPELSYADFRTAFDDYSHRKRRFGR